MKSEGQSLYYQDAKCGDCPINVKKGLLDGVGLVGFWDEFAVS